MIALSCVRWQLHVLLPHQKKNKREINARTKERRRTKLRSVLAQCEHKLQESVAHVLASRSDCVRLPSQSNAHNGKKSSTESKPAGRQRKRSTCEEPELKTK